MSIPILPENQTEAPAVTVDIEPSAGDSRWSRIAGALLSEYWLIRMALLLLGGLYLRSIAFSPVYDDNVMSSWSGKLGDWTQFFAHDIFGSDGTAHSVYYRPVAMVWEFLQCYFTGGAPGWLHLGAVLVHLVAVVLAYQFGRHLLHDGRLALLSAVLFGLHPSKVESVAWIGSSCVDGLGAVFFFASLIAFLRWCESESGRWLAASVILFAFALFTKETMVFVPILIAVYLWFTMPAAGRISRILRALPPYGAVWIVYMAIRHQVIKPVSATAEYIHPTFTWVNLWTAPFAIWWYIRHLVAPWGLCVEYAATVLDRPTLRGFFLPAVGVLLLLAACWWLWRKQSSPIAGFLIFWFVLTLAPPVIVSPMVSEHDRYLYIPAYAFCVLVAWVILYLGRVQTKAGLLVGLGIVVLWSGLTWHEMGYWDCDETLWSRVHQIVPSQPKAQVQLAFLYSEQGDFPKALSLLDEGLRYRPNSTKILLARAGILYANKQFDEAQAGYLRVMQLTDPPAGHPVVVGVAAEQRAATAYQLAVLYLSENNIAEAERYAGIALGLDFKGVGYHEVLSRIRSAQGRVEESKAEIKLEMRLRVEQQLAGMSAHP